METFLGIDYPTLWYLVVGLLFSGYAILEGFDYGAGAWHLFLKKDIFKNILKKTNLIKISKINIMLQKTEYLFRKHSEQHREILERFLLNLVKIMK